MAFTLRPYQQECADIINNLESGSYLVVLATGLGKTAVFTHLKRKGRVLILSHRDELVHQPQKYYDCSFGVEQASESSHGEEVVSASVQSMVRRLKRFSPNEFDMIITDEAHHAIAPSYQKIYDYFKPRLHIGFTATPKRGDKLGLDKIFDKIIFERDLKWGIQNKYLCNINCLQVDLGYDITKVRKRMGDFDTEELAAVIDQEKMNKGVAKAYHELAKGQTIIFATNVSHAKNIAKEIEGAVVVSAQTKNRQEIIDAFTARKIPCIVNCMIFTEGTDMPLIETVIIARPTSNESLYRQMVGRGLRLHEDKEALTLIDCVGVSGNLKLCSAPSLFGLDVSKIPENKRKQIIGLLTDMPEIIEGLTDDPAVWVINAHEVDVFAEKNNIETNDINWTMRCDGSFVCSFGNRESLVISPANQLDECDLTYINHNSSQCIVSQKPMQDIFDVAYQYLNKEHKEAESLWNMKKVKSWGKKPASSNQIKFIKTLLNRSGNAAYKSTNLDFDTLNKYQAGIIINKLLYNG